RRVEPVKAVIAVELGPFARLIAQLDARVVVATGEVQRELFRDREGVGEVDAAALRVRVDLRRLAVDEGTRAETFRAASDGIELSQLHPGVEMRAAVEIAETRDQVVLVLAEIALEHELDVRAPALLVAGALVVDGLVGQDACSRHLVREVL